MRKPLCALTMGDPAGIGPEVILKTLFSHRAKEAADMVVIGFPGPFERDAGMLDLDFVIKKIDSPRESVFRKNIMNLIVPDRRLIVPLQYGVVDARCGKAAALCIELSARLALSSEVDAVVTAPINKESLNLAGYEYPGHTEFYQSLTGAKDIAMLLSLGDLRVVHVATHTSIRDVPARIKKKRIVRTVQLLHDALKRLGMKNPRIAVSGLNPHAGEAGMFGREEIEEIIPAVEELKAVGMNITGPISPDTVFPRGLSGEFDGIVAMYHDQGHIALKLAGFKLGKENRVVEGVNTTLGLPIIRTSVDHGTAFDIAGKGIASPLSMIEAVELASQMVKVKRDPETSSG
ncbi:MAG: 4-hydroxythreonine-4-phosphate dehydrogenase PdxA [Candidatus Latescibacter sp.]|nr:4-hydroxythreonine-4-phosphate dehydrogenase PdxA [Candidatus Latescibacter sp.]